MDSTDSTVSPRRPGGMSIVLLVSGALGLLASFALTLDKFALLENPKADLNCNLSVLVGCSTGLNSAQGSVFGFPNSILGLIFWTAIIVIGAALLAGARFAAWFWALTSLATTAALALVVWFIAQSIYVLGVLCPWCMLTWVVVIPLFFVVVLHTLRTEPMPATARRIAARTVPWILPLTVVCYVVVALLAQLRLDVIGRLF